MHPPLAQHRPMRTPASKRSLSSQAMRFSGTFRLPALAFSAENNPPQRRMIKLPFHRSFNFRSEAGGERPLKEGTMCYSKYWLTEDERRAREAKSKEVEANEGECTREIANDGWPHILGSLTRLHGSGWPSGYAKSK